MNKKLQQELDCERNRKQGGRDHLLEELSRSYEEKLVEAKSVAKKLNSENLKILSDCKDKDEHLKQLIMEIESKQSVIDQLQEQIQEKDDDIEHKQ